jgi:hypothetical protein
MPSVAYMLPLIFNVLERDGIEETEDHHGEQVLLALEILSFHTDLCKYPGMDYGATAQSS